MRAGRGSRADNEPSARELARAACASSGVRIRTLHDIEELEELAAVFAAVWKAPEDEIPISAHVLRALELAGNYVAAAFASSGEMIGGSVAFAAITTPVELHSHVTGVIPRWTGAGVGFALKLDQRAWALERGITTVVWTFDPLVRRNAALNLAKLGATVTGYLHNVYGRIADELNAGDESDRLLVSWSMVDPGVNRALTCGQRTVVANDLSPAWTMGPPGLSAPSSSHTAGGPLGPLELYPGPGGEPIRALATSPVFRVRVPPDVEAMRSHHRQCALEWRYALRQVMEPVLASGGSVLGLDSEGDYVVTQRLKGGGA